MQIPGEDIILDACIEGRSGRAFLLETERHIACLPAPQDRVDRLVEGSHAIVAFRTRAVEPVDRAVGPRNKSVGAGRNGNDNFSFVEHSRAPVTSFWISLSAVPGYASAEVGSIISLTSETLFAGK